MFSEEYFVFTEDNFKKYSLRTLAQSLSKCPNDESIKVWSGRLSTGLFGLTNCKSGNRGPKRYNEIILASGNQGLNKLIELGFITCPQCRPEQTRGFWQTIKDSVYKKYSLNSLEEFTNKCTLPFDARRISWEEILPVIKTPPGRIYLPKGLAMEDLIQFQGRFLDNGFNLPQAGYYNPEVPERFTKYLIS